MAGYGTDAGLDAWLDDNGYSLPAGAPDAAVLRQRGSSYVDGLYGARFSGSPTGGYSQDRAWPRTGAVFGRYAAAIPTDEIPTQVLEASYFAALQEATTPGSLSVSASGAAQVKREKVGPIEVEYATGSGDVIADATPTFSVIEGMLAPFLIPDCAPGLGLWSVGC